MKCSKCSQTIKPIVAIDIDGTLGDYHEQFLSFMCDYFGRHLPRRWTGDPHDWEEYLGLSQTEYREAKLAYRQGGNKRSMPVFDGAAHLTKSAHFNGAEVWITTTRPYNRLDSVDPDTQEWLRRNHIYYDHLLYDEHKYRQLASIVDNDRVCFVLDDLPEQYQIATEIFGWDAAYLRLAQHNSYFDDWKNAAKNLVAASIFCNSRILEWKETHG